MPENNMHNADRSRRRFLQSAAAATAVTPAAAIAATELGASTSWRTGASHFSAPASPVFISSGNGLPAVKRAYERVITGASPTVAVVDGVTIVEDNPDDHSVGYGGLPNEDGVVQLDASVMDGPLHKAGAVGAIEDIRNPAQVALRVLESTDHVMLVGAGAKAFALQNGFPEENILTEKARARWMKWRAELSERDDLLGGDQRIHLERGTAKKTAAASPAATEEIAPIDHTWGTIHCGGVNTDGDLGACTTTSGLSWKLPGRVGDSPIIGAGMFVDNEVGCAGATGRGESVIQSCGAFQIVQRMATGMTPTEACLSVLEWIARHTKRPDLLDEAGRPNFDVVVYAVRKDGEYGSACMHKRGYPRRFAVADATGPRLEDCAVLFPE